MQEQQYSNIEDLVQQRADLFSALEQIDVDIDRYRAKQCANLIHQTVVDVEALELDVGDFMGELAKELGVSGAATTDKRTRKARRQYDFGNGFVYRGGKPPTWLVELMVKDGVDLAEKGATRAYCEKYGHIMEG